MLGAQIALPGNAVTVRIEFGSGSWDCSRCSSRQKHAGLVLAPITCMCSLLARRDLGIFARARCVFVKTNIAKVFLFKANVQIS